MQAAENNVTQLRHEFTRLRDEVASILRKEDPLRLGPGVPQDAYALEAANIIPYLRGETDPDDVAHIVLAEFRYWYGERFKSARQFDGVKVPIHEACSKYEAARIAIAGDTAWPDILSWVSEVKKLADPYRQLLRLLHVLSTNNDGYDLHRWYDNAITVVVHRAEGCWEIDFFDNGELQVEFLRRYAGVIQASQQWLEDFLKKYIPD